MKALFLIAKDNIKKKKADTIIMLLLISIATMFLYVGISVLGNIDKMVDKRNEVNNGADFLYITASSRYEEIFKIIEDNEYTVETERDEAVLLPSAKYYGEETTDEDADEIDMLFFNMEKERKISKNEIIDIKGEWKEDSIVLPYYMHVSEGYESGDKINIVFDGKTYKFEVYGFLEDVLFSTPMNISTSKILVSDKMFTNFYGSVGYAEKVCKADIDGISTQEYEKIIEEQVSKLFSGVNDNQIHYALNYDVMKSGTGMVVMIFMAMLTMFALLLIVVVLIIIKFNINNSIEENIKNTGIMEACGYTSRQMVIATILEFAIVGIAGIAIGFVLQGFAASFMGNIISSSMGLIWEAEFSVVSAVISTVAIVFFIVLVSLISARKFKKISPLDALRNGITSHNFKKNPVSLEKSPFSLNVSLGIKNTLFRLRKNIIVCGVIVILTFISNMAIAIYDNFMDTEVLIQIVGVEYTDLMVSTKEQNDFESLEKIREKLAAHPEIDKIIAGKQIGVNMNIGEDTEGISIEVYDNTEGLTTDNVVEGRLPKYGNEIAITTHMCKKYKLDIGDAVRIVYGNEESDYIIVGKIQGMSYMGKKGIMSEEGYKTLCDDGKCSYLYVYFNEGVDVEKEIAALKDELGDEVILTDFSKVADSSIGPIKMALKAFCIALISVSVIVVALILLLLIKSHIIREKKSMGICKAIGYTTPQLIIQIMASYLPTVLIGGILGAVFTRLLIHKLFVLCFSMFSIEKITIIIPFLAYVLCTLAILIWSEIIALLASLRIRKIMPYKMITEQ